MTGEMSRSEVTREAYPGLFALADALAAKGIESEPQPFDQYQGTYLYVPGRCKVWYAPDEAGETFIIERYGKGIRTFETKGADYVIHKSQNSYRCGCYDIMGAAERIEAIR